MDNTPYDASTPIKGKYLNAVEMSILVAAQAQLPLELGGGDPALAGRHQVGRQKPARQPGLGLLEDGAGEQRVLLATGDALVDDLGPNEGGLQPRRALAQAGGAALARALV